MPNRMRWFSIITLLLLPGVCALDLSMTLPNAPIEVVPGSVVSVPFQVINGANALTNVVFELEEDGTFSVVGDEDIRFATLAPLQSVPLSYTLQVSRQARTGYETIALRASTETESKEQSFPMLIRDLEPSLAISSFESFPTQFIPGKEGTLEITLNNAATYAMKNVQVKLELAGIPFAPIHSTGEKIIEKIAGRTTADVSFTLIPLGEAKTGVYKIPVAVNSLDEFGKPSTLSSLISVIVGTPPVVTVSIEKNKLITNAPGTISIRFTNTGTSDIQFFQVQLVPGMYEVTSPEKVYIGDLDSDDYETVEFTIIPTMVSVPLPLLLTYKDTNNQMYTEPVFLTASAYTPNEAQRLGLLPTNRWWYVAVVVVALVGLSFLIRRITRKRRLEMK